MQCRDVQYQQSNPEGDPRRRYEYQEQYERDDRSADDSLEGHIEPVSEPRMFVVDAREGGDCLVFFVVGHIRLSYATTDPGVECFRGVLAIAARQCLRGLVLRLMCASVRSLPRVRSIIDKNLRSTQRIGRRSSRPKSRIRIVAEGILFSKPAHSEIVMSIVYSFCVKARMTELFERSTDCNPKPGSIRDAILQL